MRLPRPLPLLWAAACALWGSACASPSEPTPRPTAERPNVVLILSDDHRYDAMGFMGHPLARTPNMDAMAKAGVHLKNTFVTTSLCSPSRASILTGLYTFRHRVIDNQRPVPKGTLFFPQYLQKAGYATNKKYADLLIRIIEDERLYRFDEVSEGILLDPHEIRRHAVGLRFIQAEKGDTWESLAAELDMSVDRLLKYNECSYDRELPPGMFVFLQKKKRRSTRADYRVQEGDDMYLISQKMGIRLKYLYQRNGLAVGAQPAVGQLLNLR